MSELEYDRNALEEQPLSSNEKQLLSEYFMLEGRRQFNQYQNMAALQQGRMPGFFEMMDLPMETEKELSDKQLSLELAQRDHWVGLIETLHERFFDSRPAPPEIEMWALMGLEKHAIVHLETGKEEFEPVLKGSQQRQVQLMTRLGEVRTQQLTRNVELFYKLLDIDGINRSVILY
ncbi:MAG: hypothetical protein ABEJ65_04220 [bacterium]